MFELENRISKLNNEVEKLQKELINKENEIKKLYRINKKLLNELHLRNYNQYKEQIIINDEKFNDAIALLFALNNFNPFNKKGN